MATPTLTMRTMTARRSSPSGKKGGKADKKGGADKDKESAAASEDGSFSAPSAEVSAAEANANTAIFLDFKHSQYKKTTQFFKDIAARTNGAFFTVPNDNEICVKPQKHLLQRALPDGSAPFREHKRQSPAFIERFHSPLVLAEEAQREAAEFASISNNNTS